MKRLTEITINIPKPRIKYHPNGSERRVLSLLFFLLAIFSIAAFMVYYLNGFGLAYNDARSHLNIGRRVVEGLKPGFAQLGSVWLPLPHLLMVPTIWSNFMWHSGLSGAIVSMTSYLGVSVIIFLFLRKIGVGLIGSSVGLLIFATNLNVLYLQSTAMTELLLIGTMTLGVYELLQWYKSERLFSLILASFWIMLATLVRYDGWFLFLFSFAMLGLFTARKYGFTTAKGTIIFFCTLAGFGIFLWFLWNLLIFKDPFYFAFGPYSARAQQQQLEHAGVLATKGNLLLSLKFYSYAVSYNSGTFIALLSVIGGILFWMDKRIPGRLRYASLALLSPFVFNVLALYLGHSVLFIQGLSGNSWFNIRYGVMMMPSIAIIIGYLVHRIVTFRPVLIGMLIFVILVSHISQDAVTIDDARYGASGKNVFEVSTWLRENANKDGFVLVSAASHDAIIFSSGLPMSKFIHEGTGLYWDKAIAHPEAWARWIVMRTNDVNDMTFKLVKQSGQLDKYELVKKYPFADIYKIKDEYVKGLVTKPYLGRLR